MYMSRRLKKILSQIFAVELSSSKFELLAGLGSGYSCITHLRHQGYKLFFLCMNVDADRR